MKALLLIILSLLSSCVSLHEFTSQHIHHLTLDDYHSIVVDNSTHTMRGGKKWLIMFYAPWCGHCKRMMPIMNEFADINQNQISIGAVDCDDNEDLCTAFDITGYPRLLLLAKDKHYRFKGERSVMNFEEFIYHGLYNEAESAQIPFEITATVKPSKISNIASSISLLIEKVFDEVGLVQVPKEIQFLMVGLLLAIPFGIIQQKCFKQKDEEQEQ